MLVTRLWPAPLDSAERVPFLVGGQRLVQQPGQPPPGAVNGAGVSASRIKPTGLPRALVAGTSIVFTPAPARTTRLRCRPASIACAARCRKLPV